MNLDEAIIYALRGESILFTGAGFSYRAENAYPADQNKIPNAREFASLLASECKKNGTYELPIISQYYLKTKGYEDLIYQLSSRFTVTKTEKFHDTIARIPWRRVYTTNYDNCFEHAALKQSKTWKPVTTSAIPSAEKNLCLHINGHITNLTNHSLENQIKLTHSSYSADSFSSSKWAQQFRQDINGAKSLIFIGYSLADIDISRILYSSPDLKCRTFFIVSPHDDEILIEPLSNYGQVLAIGIEELSNIIESTTIPNIVPTHTYSWLTEYNQNIEPKEPTGKDGIDLLTLGVVEQSHVIWSAATSTPRCYVLRSECDEILSEIERGRRWFLIHSDIGNGKTVIKHQLSHYLSRIGYKIFWDTDFDFNRNNDIAQLAKNEGNRLVLFIDESSDRFEVIDGLLRVNKDNIIVIICVRTTLYELGESKYEEYLPDDYLPIDVNKLTEKNLDDFVFTMNSLGLWGERANLSDSEKKSFISTDCTKNISKVILTIFEGSEVGKRIVKASEQHINSREIHSSLIILSFLLIRIGHSPRLSLLSELLDTDVFRITKSDKFKEAGEFIRFNGSEVKARSSVVSSYLLKKSLKPEILIYHLEKIVRRLAAMSRNTTLHHVFTELLRFPFIESIIESPKKKELILDYFNSLMDIGFCQRSSLFWLHYAMARLSFGEFKESTYYFEQARSLARGNLKETTDVNNHFAKLLLESRTNSNDYQDYFDAFLMAHSILIDQMNLNTNRHFPFRQAKTYVSFITFRKKDLTQNQIERFINSCKQVLAAIEHLRGRISHAREVEDCGIAIRRALDIAQSEQS